MLVIVHPLQFCPYNAGRSHYRLAKLKIDKIDFFCFFMGDRIY